MKCKAELARITLLFYGAFAHITGSKQNIIPDTPGKINGSNKKINTFCPYFWYYKK
jgi:hypothetical protein